MSIHVNRQTRPVISVIVPTYNESKVIGECLFSLARQTEKRIEIIVVDDGSTDNTRWVVKRLKLQKVLPRTLLLHQKHKGPGEARNLGANRALGNVLVFVDADMTFDKHFVEKLVAPIRKGIAVGTDTQEAYLNNPDNFWALSWNIGRFYSAKSKGNPLIEMIPNKSDFGGVFRAIKRKEFLRVCGFSKGGDYTDDTSLGKRLGKKARLAKGAIYYHNNPDSLSDVWQRAVWIGSDSSFLPDNLRKVLNLIKFFPLFSFFKSIPVILRYHYKQFLLFKIIYDTAIFWAIVKSI